MSQLFDLVGFTTTTTDTGTITVAAALSGHRTLAGASIADGTVVSYGISSNGGAARETGTGTVGGSGTTLTRTLSASSTGALLNLSGASEVYITAIAADMTPGGTTGALQMRDASANFGASNISQDASGRITVAAGTQTTAGSAFTVNYTANGSGQAINGLTVNMADTASATGSLPLDVQVGSVSRMSLRKDGVLTLWGASSTAAYIASSAQFRTGAIAIGQDTMGGNSLAVGPASLWSFHTGIGSNGIVLLQTSRIGWAATISVGSPSTGFGSPSVGLVEVNNGTNGQYRDLQLRNLIAEQLIQTKPLTVATLPAAASWPGAEAYVTDANAPTVGSTVASGGSGRARVGSNGTNWIVTSVI